MKDEILQEQVKSQIQSSESSSYKKVIMENVKKLKDKSREGFLEFEVKTLS